MTIEHSFLAGRTVYIKACHALDSLLYPLAQWRSRSAKSHCTDSQSSILIAVINEIEKCLLDSNVLVYCGRRLSCHPSFRILLESDVDSFAKISSTTLMMTTPVNCEYSLEIFLDDLKQMIFERMEPELFQRKLSFVRLQLECQRRIRSIDRFVQGNPIRFVGRHFRMNERETECWIQGWIRRQRGGSEICGLGKKVFVGSCG